MRTRKRRTHGEGTVYEKRTGYWEAQLRYDDTRVTGSGATPDAARRRLASKVAQREQQKRKPIASDTSVGDFLTEWIADLRATQAMKPSAWLRYESIVRLYLVPAIGDTRLCDLTKNDISTLIQEARVGHITERQLGDTSLHHIHAVLRAGLESAMAQDLIERNVARLLKAPPMRHKDKIILDREQADRLLGAARGAWLEAAIVLGITTGMRKGEILGLRRQDLHLEEGFLRVERSAGIGYSGRSELGDPKTAAARRTIFLPDMAVSALREHLMRQDPPSLLVFPSRSGGILLGTTFLTHYFRPILKKAGLPRMPFHDLRHSAATLLKEMDVDDVTISHVLGHANPAITMRLYGHVTPKLLRGAADKMDSAFREGAA